MKVSIHPFKEKQASDQVEVNAICDVCRKPKSRGSLTSWIFSTNYCNCGSIAPSTKNELAQVKQPEAELAISAVNPAPDLGERYEIMECLGQGASGTVYKVHDKELNLTLAIKVLHPEVSKDPNLKRRFIHESNLASTLAHENIVGIHGLNTAPDGTPFIVMNYLEGRSLESVLKTEGSLSEERFVEIFTQVLRGLAYAHQKGLIHRDLKPANIFLCEQTPGVEVVKLIDFGIAKLSDISLRSNHNLTQTGEVFGTPTYMSPEQCLGVEVDARCDIYSIGCVMYESMSGKVPFSGKSAMQIISKHLSAEAKRLELPNDELSDLILSCLSKEVGDRPQTPQQLLIDLMKATSNKKKVLLTLSPTSFKKMIRTKRLDILPSLRLPYGLLGLGMYLSAFFLFWCYCTSDPSFFSQPILWILASSVLTLMYIFSLSTRKVIRKISEIVETRQPIQTEVSETSREKPGMVALRFNGSTASEHYVGENAWTANLSPNETYNTWMDEKGNRIAVESGGKVLARVNKNFLLKNTYWKIAAALVLFEIFRLFARQSFFWFMGPISLLFLAFYMFKALKQKDLPLVLALIATGPFPIAMTVLLLDLIYRGHTGHSLNDIINPNTRACLEQISMAFSHYWSTIMAGSWGFYGTVRLLKNKKIIRISGGRPKPKKLEKKSESQTRDHRQYS